MEHEHDYIAAPGTEGNAYGPLVCEICGLSAQSDTRTMACSTAGLTRGQLVTVIADDFGMFYTVEDDKGTRHTIMHGDVMPV